MNVIDPFSGRNADNTGNRILSFSITHIALAVRSSFWFIPGTLAIVSVAVSIFVSTLDIELDKGNLPFLPNAGIAIESARLILSTIAGSMITVASLVFSMTLVALTMVSQQLGPRILIRFMDDRPTQIVLGLYIATFLFSLVALIRVDEKVFSGTVPGMGVILSTGLALLALGMMIHFIHHIANRIQADVLITALGNDLNSAAQKFLEMSEQKTWSASPKEAQLCMETFDTSASHMTTSDRSGYLLSFDPQAACDLATEHELLLRSVVRPGQFILAGASTIEVMKTPGGTVPPNLVEALRHIPQIGSRLTPEASIEFELRALTEIALKALSTSVNDPYTAIACIDRLTDGLRILMFRKNEQRVLRDEMGNIRLLFLDESFDRYLEITITAILNFATGNPMVLNHINSSLRSLRDMAEYENHIKAIDSRIEDTRHARGKH